jgi:hypothetical protein
MKMVEKIKTDVGKRVLTGKMTSHRRIPVVCNFNDAKNIGILYNATEYISFEIIKDFVKMLAVNQAKVTVLGYVHSKKLIDHYLYRKGFDFFSKNDLNWYYKPVSASVQQFMTEPFDLLIDLSLEDYYPVRYITSLSPATFKVGRYVPGDLSLDFMIDIEKEKNTMKSLRQEITRDAESTTEKSEIEADVEKKTEIELQLNFLINQLIHYLSIIKK